MSRTMHDRQAGVLPPEVPEGWDEAYVERLGEAQQEYKKKALLAQAKGIRPMGTDERMLAIMEKWDRIATAWLAIILVPAVIYAVTWLVGAMSH